MDKYIDIDGVRLHYTDTGNPTGKPIVIMHGYGCNVTTVASIARILEPGMRVINVDLPGHGQSDEPPAIWGVDEYTDCIEKLIRSLNLKDVSLLGHSFGGRIGILYSSRHPEVHKLVLVDAAGIKPKRKPQYYFKVYTYKTLKHLLPVLFGKKLGESLLNQYRGKAGSADYKQSSPVMRGVMSKCVNQDLKFAMPSIKAPTLLVWGSEDTATPLSDAKTMERLIPDAGLVNFEGAGHYSFLDNPTGFRAVLQEFFKKEISKS
ncbi:MAG: alpha/beta hydrolase [Muribaculaceae bacterium]|nr:alpha/beta hydrolase [Muribaculaceae bacterium]